MVSSAKRSAPPRSDTGRIGRPEHFVWLKKIIWAILILNLFDAVLTMIWIYTGRATEANPVMEELVNDYPILFVLVKTALVTLGITMLWRYRKHKLSVVAIFLAFLVYYGVLLYHLRSMNLNLLGLLGS